MNSNAPLNQRENPDEIDLLELFQSLWAQKLSILLVTGIVALVAAAYTVFATPYYEVTSMLRPAPIKNLDELNSTGVYTLEPEKALQRVGAALDSYETRVAFFNNNRELFEPLRTGDQTLEQAFRQFDQKKFSLIQPDPKRTDILTPYVGIKLEYPAGLDGVQIVNALVAQAILDERKRIVDDVGTVISNKLNSIERQMSAARANYEANKEARIANLSEADRLKRAQLQDEIKALRTELRTRRQNRITQLEEAIRIAEELGITKPTTPSSLGQDGTAAKGNVFRTEVFNQQFPLYFMGTEALEAERNSLSKRRSDDHTEPRIAEIQKELQLLEHNREIEVLNSRENEDLFLKKLADLREEAAQLNAIEIDLSKLSLVTIDQPAVEPLRPIKPKKLMIVALGVVLGGMLGVFIALIRGILKKRI